MHAPTLRPILWHYVNMADIVNCVKLCNLMSGSTLCWSTKHNCNHMKWHGSCPRPVGLLFRPQSLCFRPVGLHLRPVGLRFRHIHCFDSFCIIFLWQKSGLFKAQNIAQMSELARLLFNIYHSCLADYHQALYYSKQFGLQRGVWQCDTSSPKLFIASSEKIFWKLSWKMKGIKIDSEYFGNLWFAGDISNFIFANNIEEFQEMLHKLNYASLKVGLSINLKENTEALYN